MTLTKEKTVGGDQEKTWAERTQELLPKLIECTSIPNLIDQGISGGAEGTNFSCLIEDEENQEERNQYQKHQKRISELITSLPAADREAVEGCLEEMETMFYMRAHHGADKMADILIRFYLRHHLGFQIPLKAKDSAQECDSRRPTTHQSL